MLVLQDLHAHYGRSHVLRGVNLSAAAGEVTAILGRNGMGKSTLLRAVTRRIPLSGGTVGWNGVDLSRAATHVIARHGIAHMPQGVRVFPSLTVMEHLRLAERLGRDKHAESGIRVTIEEVFEWFPRLADRRALGAGNLSGGERQALSLSRCLLNAPNLLLLDEPTEGLSPAMTQQFGQLLGDLVGRGLTLLLVEQNVRFAVELAAQVHVFKNGQVDVVFDRDHPPDEHAVRAAVMSA